MLAWLAAGFIIVLNLKLVYDFITENLSATGLDGIIIKFLLIPVVVFLVALLFWITVEPYFKKARLERFEEIFIKKPLAYAKRIPVTMSKPEIYKKIAIAFEGKAERDEQIIKGALPFLKTSSAKLYLIHCVETVTGRFIGDLVADERAKEMTDYINRFAEKLKKDDFVTQTVISGGEPEDEIAKICKQEEIELLIVGSHGHKLVSDIIYGSTANEVRHRVRIPVLAIPVEV